MEPIYEWLLLHMGNEANYYTILNCQRDTTPEGLSYLRVMGRLREFKVINLFIYTGQAQNSPVAESDQNSGNEQPRQVSFANSQQVIEYLATGKVADSASQTDEDSFHVLVLDPVGNAGEITFPPENQ